VQRQDCAACLGVVALADVEDGLEVAEEAVLQVLGREAEQACKDKREAGARPAAVNRDRVAATRAHQAPSGAGDRGTRGMLLPDTRLQCRSSSEWRHSAAARQAGGR
jgi:hypothetical protein